MQANGAPFGYRPRAGGLERQPAAHQPIRSAKPRTSAAPRASSPPPLLSSAPVCGGQPIALRSAPPYSRFRHHGRERRLGRMLCEWAEHSSRRAIYGACRAVQSRRVRQEVLRAETGPTGAPTEERPSTECLDLGEFWVDPTSAPFRPRIDLRWISTPPECKSPSARPPNRPQHDPDGLLTDASPTPHRPQRASHDALSGPGSARAVRGMAEAGAVRTAGDAHEQNTQRGPSRTGMSGCSGAASASRAPSLTPRVAVDLGRVRGSSL